MTSDIFEFDFGVQYNGIGICAIEKISTNGSIDTYLITYTDDSTSTFEVSNGEKGDQGVQGEQGEKGEQGIQGEKGDAYELTSQDKLEIAELTQEEATNIFNTNVEEKTESFENLTQTKETALTSISTSLTADFNQNAETQTATFNENAAEKLDDIDTVIDDYLGGIENLETENKSNLVSATNEVNTLARSSLTELEAARESFLGEMYDSIYDRLRADFESVYNRFNEASLMPYSGEIVNATNSYVGLSSNTIIKGVTAQDDDYIQSVASDLIIKSVGKNLQKNSIILSSQGTGWCDAYGFNDGNGNATTSTSVWLKAGTAVYVKITDSYNLGTAQFRQTPVDGQEQQIVPVNVNGDATAITIANDGYYTIKSYISSAGDTYFGNIMFEIGTSASDYESYTEDSVTYSNIILRSLPNGICDTIENGSLTQRVGSRAFETDDYNLSNIYTDGTTTLYELDDYVDTKIATKELRTYDGVTNIFSTGTTIKPIISTNIACNIKEIVSELIS